MLLRGVTAAGTAGDRAATQGSLTGAKNIARYVALDRPDAWADFSPTNVEPYAVSATVALGDAGAALETARPLMPRPTPAPERRAALWAAAAAGIAGDVGKLITTAQERNRDVGVVATPQGLGFIDLQPVKAQTGYPIRSAWRSPGDPRPLPRRDAIAVAPATFNTINKWAAGTSDTLAVGILREAYGLGVPPKPGGGRDTFRWEQALELLSSKMR